MAWTWEDRLLRLPDGRRLSYAMWGDPKGPPVVLMHGWPGSRLDGRLVEAALGTRGIWLIVPERPGFGRSDPQPGRTLLDWSRDINALSDSLQLGRFAVIGYSGGAPYGLACAYRIPDRLSGVAVVSGMAPLHTMRAMTSLPPHLSAIFALCRRAPSVSLVPAGLMALGVRYFPEAIMRQARLTAKGTDRVVLSRPSVSNILKAGYSEGFRQGAQNVAYEVSLFSRHWGFSLDALPPGIHVYHGTSDRFVPVAMAHLFEASLPASRCRFIAGAGHFWIVDHIGEVLDDLLSSHTL